MDSALKMPVKTEIHLKNCTYMESLEEFVTLYPHVSFVFDLNGNLLMNNPVANLIFGPFGEDYNLFKSNTIFYHDKYKKFLDEAFSGKTARIPEEWYRINTVHQISEKNEACYRISTFPVYDPDKKFIAVVFIYQDVTKEMKYKEDVLRSEEKYRLLFEASNDAISIIQNEKFVFVNPKFYSLTGYTKEEVEELDPYSLSAPESIDSLKEIVSSIKSGQNKCDNFDIEAIKKNGERLWLNLRISKIIWEGMPAFLNLSQNITERKMHEQKLEQLYKEMESFLYCVSHDLKSPLLSIEGLISMTLSRMESQPAEQTAAQLERVSSNAATMSKMIDDLLKLSRISRAKELPEKVDVTVIIRQIIACAKSRQENIDFEIPDESFEATYPRTMLADILFNLIENAIKFSSRVENPSIIISFEKDQDESRILISDNGIGIDERFHEEIFMPFKRLVRNDDFPGTGMGLVLAKKIVETYGGQILVDSKPNEGSTFTIVIPDK